MLSFFGTREKKMSNFPVCGLEANADMKKVQVYTLFQAFYSILKIYLLIIDFHVLLKSSKMQ